MATLKNIFDKCGVALYQNESLDLDHYYQEPYQDEGDEIKAIGKPFETNDSNKIRKYDLFAEDRTFSNFSFFMDGSRRTYKIGDIVIDGGKKIYPVVIAQIRAGCTERDGAKKLHSHQTILRKNLLLLSDSSLYVGGIMASLMPKNIVEATGIDRSHILTGLFTDTSVVGDNNDINVDQLPLDYDILEDVNYKYPAGDNYFAYTTRGCPNHCSFCAVPILEPSFHVTNNIVEQIRAIDQKYGPKQHLLLLDNNVLNTPNLESLVNDLCAAGFGRGAKYVDPGTYNIVMMRYHNGDRAEFLDKKMTAYLGKFKKRIKSPEKLDTFLQIVIGAEEAEDYAGYMLKHEDELSSIVEKYRSKTPKARYLDFNQGVDGRKINIALLLD